MRRLLVIACMLLGTVNTADAVIDRNPQHSLLWNGFNSVTIVDSFAVATTKDGMVVLTPDPTGILQPVDHLFLTTEPFEQKRTGTVLTVRDEWNVLYFVDISDLPTLKLLGTANLGMPFNDYALFGQDLYISAGYKGLLRYTMINYGSLMFADSSMVGIHCTQLDIYGDELYVLDDYNGILRYKLTGIGFGFYQDILPVPYRATSFTKIDTTVAVAVYKPMLMLATFNGSQPHITATIDLFYPAERLLGADSHLVALNHAYDIAELINLESGSRDQFALASPLDSLMRGQALSYRGGDRLLLPVQSGGFSLYNLDSVLNDPTPEPIFKRPGPITDVWIYQQKLYTGGLGNPLDMYALGADGEPLERNTVYPSLTRIQALDLEGGYLATYYPSLRHTLLLNLREQPLGEPLAIFVGDMTTWGIDYNNTRIDTLRSLIAFGDYTVSGYTISDSGGVAPAFDLSVVDKINDVTALDSLFFVTTGKARVLVYRIYRDFDIELVNSFGLAHKAMDLNRWGDKLLILSGSDLVIYDPGLSPLNTAGISSVVRLPFAVLHSAVDGDKVALCGDNGFVLVDLARNPPQIMDYGGRGGDRIALEDGIVAVSNRYALHIFDVRDVVTDIAEPSDDLPRSFSLSQNYPNPFNPSTTIEYSLPVRSKVTLSVFNILGQQVTTLVDEEQPAGTHAVPWDGTSDSGNGVASGVYLYRIKAGGFSDTRKMILLK